MAQITPRSWGVSEFAHLEAVAYNGVMSEDEDLAYEVGAWRFCPVCTKPVEEHPALGPRVIDGVVSEDDLDGIGDHPANYRNVSCSGCSRPWIACPCHLSVLERERANARRRGA